MDFKDPVILDFGGAHSRLIPLFVDKCSCWKPLVEWEKTCKPQTSQKNINIQELFGKIICC